MLTQCLNVILVPAALDVFHHQTRFADLGIADHADLDDDARVLLCLLPLRFLPVLALRLWGGLCAHAVAVLTLVGGAALGLRGVGSREAGVGV